MADDEAAHSSAAAGNTDLPVIIVLVEVVSTEPVEVDVTRFNVVIELPCARVFSVEQEPTCRAYDSPTNCKENTVIMNLRICATIS